MISLTRQELNRSIENILSNSKLLETKFQSLGMLVSDSPKQEHWSFDFTDLRISTKKRKDLIILSILSWYVSEEIAFLLRLSLSQNWKGQNSEVKEILLTSKECCLSWLQIQTEFNERDFFGNLLTKKKLNSLAFQLSFRKLSTRKVERYTGYCRGYRNSNTRRRNDVPTELRISSRNLTMDQLAKLESQRIFLLFLLFNEVERNLLTQK